MLNWKPKHSYFFFTKPKGSATMDSQVPSFIFIPKSQDTRVQQQHAVPDRRNCYSDSRLNCSTKSIGTSSAHTPEMDATRDDSTELWRERWLSSPSSSRQQRSTLITLPPNFPRRLPERSSRKGLKKGTPIPFLLRTNRSTNTSSTTSDK